MKKIIFLILLTISFTIFAKSIVLESFYIDDPQNLSFFINQKELTIDHVSKKGFELYGPEGLETWLQNLNINYIKIERLAGVSGYPSTQDNNAKLKKYATDHPDIFKAILIGKSSKGEEFWGLLITKNPDVAVVRPEFKYIANMHGDEVVGREMLMSLIGDIANDYYQGNTQIINLVNNTKIYIIPTMNPDGFKKQQRGNGNNADLNRDFPDFISDPNNTDSSREPEVKSIMAFEAAHSFALSANYHDGSSVVNYPWDSTGDIFPFDSLIKNISLDYAKNIPYFYNSSEFNQGVTNGYDWYLVHGGMQDWSYYWYGDLQVTIEVSETKWPKYSEVTNFYKLHKSSMINYIQSTHQGAGFVFNQKNISGKVTIFNANNENLGEFPFGNSQFYKVLEKGNYIFEINTSDNKKYKVNVLVTDAVSINGNYKYLDL